MKKTEKLKTNYVKLSELADEIGLSRIAVFKAGQRGTFLMEDIDGTWQADKNNESVIKYCENVRKRKNKTVAVKEPKKPKTLKPVKVKESKPAKKDEPVKVTDPKPEKKEKPSKKQEPVPDIPQDVFKRLDSGETLTTSEIVNMPKVWVEKIRIYEQTKQIKQRREFERRELISKKLIRIMFGKLYEIDINEFMTLKNKIIPDIAGIMGCTDQTKMLESEKRLDEELWKVLKHVKHEIDRFIKKIGAERG